MPQQQLSVITHSITVSRIRSLSLGRLLNCWTKNRINAFFKRLRGFGYIDCVMIIDDLIDRSDYELFTKVCSWSHSLYHLLSPYRTSDLRLRGHSFQLICTKSHSLFDFCVNILNIIVGYIGISCLVCFYCFYVFSVFTAIALMCLWCAFCRILIKITHLLTYLLTKDRSA